MSSSKEEAEQGSEGSHLEPGCCRVQTQALPQTLTHMCTCGPHGCPHRFLAWLALPQSLPSSSFRSSFVFPWAGWHPSGRSPIGRPGRCPGVRWEEEG